MHHNDLSGTPFFVFIEKVGETTNQTEKPVMGLLQTLFEIVWISQLTHACDVGREWVRGSGSNLDESTLLS